MSEKLLINSAVSDRELLITNLEGENFTVQLRGEVCAKINVYGYSPSGPGINSWFRELGAQQFPWENDISWESLEGEFTLTATCDSLGHVVLAIGLFGDQGSEESFSLKLGLQIELGQLKQFSEAANVFFGQSSNYQIAESGN